MKVIVGLGNPGREYARTPHNAGFEAIEELARRHGCSLRRSFRFRARTGKGAIAGERVLLVQPLTFMNNSGSVVAAVIRKTGATAGDLVVVADDADLPEGRVRIRTQGGSGGHKGVQSILDHLGQDGFARVRIGIGRSRGPADLAEHVLTPLSAEAWKGLAAASAQAADAVACLLERGAEAAMNDFNSRR